MVRIQNWEMAPMGLWSSHLHLSADQSMLFTGKGKVSYRPCSFAHCVLLLTLPDELLSLFPVLLFHFPGLLFEDSLISLELAMVLMYMMMGCHCVLGRVADVFISSFAFVTISFGCCGLLKSVLHGVTYVLLLHSWIFFSVIYISLCLFHFFLWSLYSVYS